MYEAKRHSSLNCLESVPKLNKKTSACLAPFRSSFLQHNLRALVPTILAQLSRSGRDDGRSRTLRRPVQPPWIQEILDLFTHGDGDPDFAPDYEYLAQSYNMSVSSLRRRFRQATGTAIHAYVLQCRVARAKTLLIETNLPMKGIAQQLGYSDVYYFSRQFHDLVGVTPTIYRESQHLTGNPRHSPGHKKN